MAFAVFSENLKSSIIIPSCTGVTASEYYNGIGKLTMILPYSMDKKVLDNIELNRVIAFDQSFVTGADPGPWAPAQTTTFYVINAIEYNDKNESITIHGDTANSLLNRRCVMNNGGSGGYVQSRKFIVSNVSSLFDMLHRCTDRIDTFYDKNNKPVSGMDAWRAYFRIPHFSFAEATGFDAVIPEYSVPHSQLLDAIIPILHIMGYGQRVSGVSEDGELIFQLIRGTDRSASKPGSVSFSDVNGTAKNFVWTKDLTVYYSNVLVFMSLPAGYQWPTGALLRSPEGKRVEPPTGSFGHAYVTYTEASVIDPNNDNYISTAEQDAQATAAASEACKKREYRETLSCEIEIPVNPKTKYTGYALGDTVTIHSARHNVVRSAVINGWQYTLDALNENVKLIVGEPDVTYMENAEYANH